MNIGVDGCPDGWIAVFYDQGEYETAKRYKSIEELWADHGASAETILIDVPIGLREDSKEPRPCDTAAREKLSPDRHRSVFPPPVRAAVHEDSYEAAKKTQEDRTEGSLGVQSWGIADKIAEVDTFLRDTEPGAKATIREAHPEVCFWALNDEGPMQYSKTGQPAAAFWERVDVLKEIDGDILDHLRDAGTDLDADVENDDLLDAFVLAVTASSRTGSLCSLPAEPPEDDGGDPTGSLPMEIVFVRRK